LWIRAWLPVFFFTGIIAFPALFFTPGPRLMEGSSITRAGPFTAALLLARVETAVTLTTVLVLTTRWTHILKALRSLGVPREAVMMLGMAHRYIFVMAGAATQMFESRESRRIGVLPAAEGRRVATRTAGVLMSKSMDLSQEVFLAMQSRGYRGEVHIVGQQRMRARDFAALFAFLAVAAWCIWVGR
jgi:energy-coupling factor transporter transmembrane protein EcfT